MHRGPVSFATIAKRRCLGRNLCEVREYYATEGHDIARGIVQTIGRLRVLRADVVQVRLVWQELCS